MRRSHRTTIIVYLCILFTPLSTTADVLPLEGRLPTIPGGTNFQAYYDPNLNITWAATDGIETEALGSATNISDMWLDNFEINGITEWRFPNMDVNGDGTIVDCSGGGVVGCVDNEFGFLFWEEGISISHSSPFDISYPGEIGHWSGTLVGPSSNWSAFNFNNGDQFLNFREDPLKTWAVRSGDVAPPAPVPVPVAAWLFGSGLLGLIGIARRKKV